MFTQYKKINQINNPLKNISINDLYLTIKNNKQDYLIKEIRKYKSAGDEYYKELKRELNIITPFATNTKKNKNNCVDLSGYIYLDLDNLKNPVETKQELITLYGSIISLTCLSASATGLSIFVPVTYQNTTEEMIHQLPFAVEYVKSMFPDFEFDSKTKDLARGLYISSDADVYYNPASTPISLPYFNNAINTPIKIKQETKIKNSKGESNNAMLNIDEVLQVLKLQTEVINENRIVDFSYINDYTKIYIPKLIQDGSKRKIYYAIVTTLLYLNPGIETKYILSFINYINNTHAKPRMDYKEMLTHVNNIIRQVEIGVIDLEKVVKTKIKKIHFDKNSGLHPHEKRKQASIINGAIRKNESINEIKKAIKQLQNEGKKVTKVAVAKLSGVGLTTVKKHWDNEITDIYVLIDEINNMPVVIVDSFENTISGLNDEIREEFKDIYNTDHDDTINDINLNFDLTPAPFNYTPDELIENEKIFLASLPKKEYGWIREKEPVLLENNSDLDDLF